ncbi:two-component system chemotaxis response regulator CheB [Dyadobacter jejuensis]|uniref:protein-glutamate methylesterase n=1 Tax=Dyadobacter jejuensis TaxID=1082580 RepID=A0A316APU4_9BACT|nr:chemotaxis protein CheB [Dyadobacter jejuensis]PWJ58850.1 two-component system chemotaxis response regulator CheB [Dyadobacter jejuensis]
MEKNEIRSKLVVIGGSAGSLPFLFEVLPRIYSPIQFSILIVLHRMAGTDSNLEALLRSKCSIPIIEVEDKLPLQDGYIYLAPADYHLLIEEGRSFALDDDEKIHFSRPCIDVTFQSVAQAYGSRATGILLSGANEDGTLGMASIRKYGGLAIVQNPASAQMPVMPQSAIDLGHYDRILGIEQIVSFLNEQV